MLDRVDEGVQACRRKNAGAFLKDLAIHEAGDGRQDHISPVRQRPRTVVEMRAAENQCSQKQRGRLGAESLHQRVLNETAKQDLFGKRRPGQDYKELSSEAERRRARRRVKWRQESESPRSEEHTSELQSRQYLVCRLLLEKKK